MPRTIIVGVDENGLGPTLGPLVATAATIELDGEYDHAKLHAFGARLGIDDSKVRASFRNMEFAESIALALIGESADADSFFEGVLLGGSAPVRARCPHQSEKQCWSAHTVPAFGGRSEQGRAILDELARAGIRVRRVRSAVACPRMLHERARHGRHRYAVDIELFCALIADARAAADEDVTSICGMVGGFRRYARELEPLGRVRMIEESRLIAHYRVANVGDVRFEVDCDGAHLPVALASLVGKYVRELWMARQNAFYRSRDESLPEASGYHDPITRRFIDGSRALRKKLKIAADCFERPRASDTALAKAKQTLLEL